MSHNTPDATAAQDALRARIANYNGAKYPKRGDLKRAHRTTVEYKGVELRVDYDVDGYYLAATDIDDASSPTCIVRAIYIEGVDVTRLLESDRDDIAMSIERSWEGE
jgi:hypothetical protein